MMAVPWTPDLAYSDRKKSSIDVSNLLPFCFFVPVVLSQKAIKPEHYQLLNHNNLKPLAEREEVKL